MHENNAHKLWLTLLIVVLLACAYPLYMGIRVVEEMAFSGAVPLERYPKYVIPYTPIAVALIFGTATLPLWQRFTKRFALATGGLCSTAVFLAVEQLMEHKILVQATERVALESWQMALCYIAPEQYQTRTWEAVDVLLGGYSPAFKLHFYLISVVMLLSLLGVIYGFVKMHRTGDTSRKKALIIQCVTALSFLGMCIWACFTSFYRSGEITVSPLSAVLMALFFVLLGVTAGVFAGSFLLGRRQALSVVLPATIALIVTTAMYAGELVLLSGHLYRFGAGFFFDGLGALVLAPADLVVILLSGSLTGSICTALQPKQQ